MKITAQRRSGSSFVGSQTCATPSRENGTRAQPRRLRWSSMVALIGLLALASIILTGCEEPMAIAAVDPTPTVYAPPPTDIPSPSPGPTPAALVFPLPAPTEVETEPVDDQTCVVCHTNQGVLKQLAAVVEVKESASEGEG